MTPPFEVKILMRVPGHSAREILVGLRFRQSPRQSKTKYTEF